MLGALAGDIIGSRFERSPTKSKDFALFTPQCHFTDDSVLTLAVAWALLEGQDYATGLRLWGRRYPHAGYGGAFFAWLQSDNAPAYNSWGNGAAMRVSPVGWFYDDLETVLQQAAATALPTHNHPEGVKAARAVAGAVCLARQGQDKDALRAFLETRIGYDMQRSIAEIRPWYGFDVSSAGSVPEALLAFLEAEDFEDTVRTAVSLGGDSDTQACIAGAVAEAAFGLPPEVEREVRVRLDPPLLAVVDAWQERLRGIGERGGG